MCRIICEIYFINFAHNSTHFIINFLYYMPHNYTTHARTQYFLFAEIAISRNPGTHTRCSYKINLINY